MLNLFANNWVTRGITDTIERNMKHIFIHILCSLSVIPALAHQDQTFAGNRISTGR